MTRRAVIVTALSAAVAAAGIAAAFLQTPAIKALDEKALREYAGVYEWAPEAFLYLQLWNEFSGDNHLIAFDESGDVRTLYPTDEDRFFTGPGAAVSASVESRVSFQRDATGAVTMLSWQREGTAARVARRVDVERREDVRFANRDVQLAGTLIKPSTGAKHPAVILIHGSGPATREAILPFARFLIRHGMAVLGYDKRGVGGSSGDWNSASFEDLAGDAVAAFEYLRTRGDIDGTGIGLLGVSQAGWVMPIAAVRAPQLAFLISVSGAGIPGGETMIDHARNEMIAGGMPRATVEQILEVMTLQQEFVRTGRGWEEYAALRAKLAARMGTPPDNIPGTPDHPWLRFIRPLVAYDPAPTLRRLQVPTLALFGELDNNILAEKNKAAWQRALEAGGHPDYTLEILPRANHLQLEARTGTNAEMASLQRFVPAYSATVRQWLAKRLPGFGTTR